MNEEPQKGNFRILVASYWFMGLAWGYLMLKLSDFWFVVGVIVSSLICGFGGKAIEKAHDNLIYIAVLKERLKHVKRRMPSFFDHPYKPQNGPGCETCRVEFEGHSNKTVSY